MVGSAPRGGFIESPLTLPGSALSRYEDQAPAHALGLGIGFGGISLPLRARKKRPVMAKERSIFRRTSLEPDPRLGDSEASTCLGMLKKLNQGLVLSYMSTQPSEAETGGISTPRSERSIDSFSCSLVLDSDRSELSSSAPESLREIEEEDQDDYAAALAAVQQLTRMKLAGKISSGSYVSSSTLSPTTSFPGAQAPRVVDASMVTNTYSFIYVQYSVAI
jgi:hypothetical protein